MPPDPTADDLLAMHTPLDAAIRPRTWAENEIVAWCAKTGRDPDDYLDAAEMPARSPQRPAEAPTDRTPGDDTPAAAVAATGRPAHSWPPPDPADLGADLDDEAAVRRDFERDHAPGVAARLPNPLGADGPDDGGAA